VRSYKLGKPRYKGRVLVYGVHAPKVLVTVDYLKGAQLRPRTVEILDVDNDRLPFQHLHSKVVHRIKVIYLVKRPALFK
jgi:hypothetical protein